MNLSHHGQQQEPENTPSDAALVVPLDTLDRTMLPVAGGKAANLGELLQAGFVVPAGFCVTTAAYERVSTLAGLDTYLAGLEAADRSDRARQIELAAAVQAGRLNEAGDLFFLTLAEANALLSGADLRECVSERRASFARELGRRHVPLVLLSNGTEPLTQIQKGQSDIREAGTLQGTPASPGRVTAIARVVLDPHDAHLEPGEILVAPSTDPGWTPLFLKAAGLVMEVGGAMAHGAIVAPEYGLPAVVGVAGATERIATGRRVTLDGTTGAVVIESNN